MGYSDEVPEFPNLDAGFSKVMFSVLDGLIRKHSICAEDVVAFAESAEILVRALPHPEVSPVAVALLLAEVMKQLTEPELRVKFLTALNTAGFPGVVSELLDPKFEDQSLAAMEAIEAYLNDPLSTHRTFSPIIGTLMGFIRSSSPRCAGSASDLLHDILWGSTMSVEEVLGCLRLDAIKFALTLERLTEELFRGTIGHRLRAFWVITFLLPSAKKYPRGREYFASATNHRFISGTIALLRLSREHNIDWQHVLWRGLLVLFAYAAPDDAIVIRGLQSGLLSEVQLAIRDNNVKVRECALVVKGRLLLYPSSKEVMLREGMLRDLI
jgi:hypothetical protein